MWCKFDLVDVSKLKSSVQTQQDFSSISTTTPQSCYQALCDNYLHRKQQQTRHQGIFRCLSAQFNSRKQSESALCDQPACQFSQGWTGESAGLDQAVDVYTQRCKENPFQQGCSAHSCLWLIQAQLLVRIQAVH